MGRGDWAEKEQKNTYRDKYIVVIASRNGLKLFDVRTFKKNQLWMFIDYITNNKLQTYTEAYRGHARSLFLVEKYLY